MDDAGHNPEAAIVHLIPHLHSDLHRDIGSMRTSYTNGLLSLSKHKNTFIR